MHLLALLLDGFFGGLSPKQPVDETDVSYGIGILLSAKGPKDKKADLIGPLSSSGVLLYLLSRVFDGLAVFLVHLFCPAVNGLELPFSGRKEA